jgi:hypothetical protein
MCSAQDDDFVRGRVLDKNTGEPVVFATILIKDKAIGIISNLDGGFQIPLKYKLDGEKLRISSMGYSTIEVALSDFSIEEIKVIYLEPAILELEEVTVSERIWRKPAVSSRDIVRKAIKLIPNNYPNFDYSQFGYYRDYQKKDSKYVNVNEAFIEVFDKGFNTKDDKNTVARIFEYRQNKNFNIDSFARKPYDYESYNKVINNALIPKLGGNEFRILRIHDAIRNFDVYSYDYVGKLNFDFLETHKFSKPTEIEIDNEPLWEIDFEFPEYRLTQVEGKIYISKRTYAIYKFEYAVFYRTQNSHNRIKNRFGHRKKLIFDITSEYQPIDGKMYLRYISFHNNFVVRLPPKFKIERAGLIDGFCCFVDFNKLPPEKQTLKKSNYSITYQGRPLKVNKVVFFHPDGNFDFSKRVILEPDIPDELHREIDFAVAQQLVGPKSDKNVLEIEVKKLKDAEGNLINEWTEEEYDQYREFFVQRTSPGVHPPMDGVFMDFEKPIFGDQTIGRPVGYEDYWMNTPLKTLKE